MLVAKSLQLERGTVMDMVYERTPSVGAWRFARRASLGRRSICLERVTHGWILTVQPLST